MIITHIIQTCDKINSWQGSARYATDDRTLLSKTCVTSFLEAVKYVTEQRPECKHVIRIIDDHSSRELFSYLMTCEGFYNRHNIKIYIHPLITSGVMESIQEGYSILSNSNTDLVNFVQDDYLWTKTSLFEMIDVLTQIRLDLKTDPIVYGFNNPLFWRTIYSYKVTPRLIFPGAYQYWLSCYDIPCSFLTSKEQFIRHQDLYEKFFNTPLGEKDLENLSLNKILVERGVLGVQPFTSVCLHLQDEYIKDPYIDWQKRWDDIKYVC